MRFIVQQNINDFTVCQSLVWFLKFPVLLTYFVPLQTLYDMLMDMLDERGIDDTFVNNMVDFATSYEHKQYVEFLEKLKSVIKE